MAQPPSHTTKQDQSEEVTVLIIATPAPGKRERLSELINAFAAQVRKQEPGCTQYQLLQPIASDANTEEKVYMIEVFKSLASIQAHRERPETGELFKTIAEEGLFAGPPEIVELKGVGGFRS